MSVAARTITKEDNLPLITLDQLKADFAHVEAAVTELEAEAAKLPPVIEDTEDMDLATTVAGKLIKAAKRCETIRNEQNRPHIDAQKVNNDFFTRGMITRLENAKSKVEALAKAYLRKKAAREQAIREQQAADARREAEAAAAKLTEAVKAGDVPASSAAVVEANSLAAAATKATSAASAPVSSMASTTTSAGNATLVDNWTFKDVDINTLDLEALRPFFAQAAIEQALRQFIKSGRREIKGADIFNDNDARFRAGKD